MKESDAQRSWEWKNDPARIDQDDEREVHEIDWEEVATRKREARDEDDNKGLNF